MIFEPQKYLFIWHDALYSLGVGFLCGFFNRLLSSFLYRGKVCVFIRDVLSCLFFALMLFSYTVSFANYRVLRWYNVAFAFAGAVMFMPAFDRCTGQYRENCLNTKESRPKNIKNSHKKVSLKP